MYYVLFHWTKGKKERDFRKFRSEKELIDFLHEKYKEISVYTIIEPVREYQLGLIETGAYIKSALETKEEELDEEKPADYLDDLKPEGKQHPIVKNKKEEPSAMEKIAGDIEEEQKEDELTPEQRTKKALEDADQLIQREKLRQEQAKKGWRLCTECNSNRISPANKTGICTPCQTKRKTNRPYKSRKKAD